MLAVLAMTVALAQPSTHLAVEPWTGKDLVATTSTAAKYRLLVTGKPNTTIRLQATDVAAGWIAAFCTPSVCSPTRVDVALPKSGQATFQFELIREQDNAPPRSGARIMGDDGAFVRVPPASR